ncbi:MAG: thiamine-phosphate kinase [Planctomycetaceae bacterium]|nr:thiamine-phosphate kinase [Planctomycetaceae bacterium]
MLENDLIRLLTQQCRVLPPVRVGIGDDGAVLQPSGSEPVVVVTDMLLDGVHFRLDEVSAELAGRKAIAVNLSDLAAMGCRPTAAFVSLAVPRSSAADPDQASMFLRRLYSGISDLADEYQFTIAGGDTNSWDGPFAVNVCLTGTPFVTSAQGGSLLLRSGARPGDRLLVTGALGGSLASGRHLTFIPRLEMSEWLVRHFDIHAMMDVSDGLSMDLPRMLAASNTGAVLESNRIPIHPDVDVTLSDSKRLSAAMGDGEDFELLFAVDGQTAQAIASREDCPVSVSDIGMVTAEAEFTLRGPDGQLVSVATAGYEHRL